MGFGDVKAAASLGATLGLIQPELALWTLCLASAITGGWGIARRGSPRRARTRARGGGARSCSLVGACAGIEVNAWR